MHPAWRQHQVPAEQARPQVGDGLHISIFHQVCFLDLADPACCPDDWCLDGPYTTVDGMNIRRYIVQLLYRPNLRLHMPQPLHAVWSDTPCIMRVANVPDEHRTPLREAIKQLWPQQCYAMTGSGNTITIAAGTYRAHCRVSRILDSFGLKTTDHRWMRPYVDPDGLVLQF